MLLLESKAYLPLSVCTLQKGIKERDRFFIQKLGFLDHSAAASETWEALGARGGLDSKGPMKAQMCSWINAFIIKFFFLTEENM